MPHICVVIDDAIGDDSMKRNSLLTSFITKSRHWNADVILSLQSFKSCPKVSRINLTDVLIGYPIPSQAMKKDLIEEFADNFVNGEEEYTRLYHEATQKKRFNFMKYEIEGKSDSMFIVILKKKYSLLVWILSIKSLYKI